MTANRFMAGRRALLAGAGISLGWAAGSRALAATGVAALDTAAIPIKSPSSALLVAITLTPGNRLVAVGEHGVVIYSDDAGKSWTQGNVPVNVTLNCVRFADKDIGWAAGHFGVVLNTIDGGKNWVMQLNGVEANKLIEAAADSPDLASSQSPNAPVAKMRADKFTQAGPDKPFMTIQMLGPRKLLVLGAYRLAMLTNDGGKSWQEWSLHIYDKYSHNIYDSAMINGVIYIVLEEGLMFSSNDGGNSFLPMTSPGSASIFGVLGAKDGSLVVYGVAGFVAHSTDGGKSWNSPSISTQEDITCGHLLASGEIVLMDEAGLVFQSPDNGATFKRVQNIQPQPFFDFVQTPDGDLVTVGAGGVSHISKSLLAA